jgi:hypothetical protein
MSLAICGGQEHFGWFCIVFFLSIFSDLWWTGAFLAVLCSLGVFPTVSPTICGGQEHFQRSVQSLSAFQ